MKNLVLLLLFLLMLTSHTYAQLSEKDPLITQFENEGNDSLKLALLKKILNKYQNRDFDIIKKYTDIGLEMVKGTDDVRSYCGFLRILGKYYYAKSDLDSAVISYEEGLDMAEKSNDILSVIMIKTDLAETLLRKGQIDKATNIYLETIEIAKKEEKYDVIIAASFGIANVYGLQGNYEKALRHILEAEPYCSKFEGNRQLQCKSTISSNLASSYSKLGKHHEAIQKAKEAEVLKKKIGFTVSLDDTYMIIANSYMKLDSMDLATRYYEKAKLAAERVGKKTGMLKASNKLFKVYVESEQNEKAGAIIVAHQSAMLKSKNLMLKREFFRLCTKFYEKFEDHRSTMIAYKQLAILNDSLFNIEKNDAITEMQTKYETERIEEEKVHAEEIAAKNYRSFLTTLIASVLGLLALIFFYFQMKQKKKAELASAELAQVESELKALRSQMNPHFIFNSLNSIQDLILKEETDLSYDYVVMFADLVRKTLHHSEKKFLPLEEEIELLETYLSLEKLRFKRGFDYEINDHTEDEINVPSLLIQPFIENAIKHGLLHKKGEKYLKIDYHQKEDTLICTIEDNGIGREEASRIRNRQSPGHQSFSTDAIRKRLDYLGEQYGIESNFSFEDVIGGGTRVIIRMPYRMSY